MGSVAITKSGRVDEGRNEMSHSSLSVAGRELTAIDGEGRRDPVRE